MKLIKISFKLYIYSLLPVDYRYMACKPTVCDFVGMLIVDLGVEIQDQRGAADGWSMTGISFFKEVAPTGTGMY